MMSDELLDSARSGMGYPRPQLRRGAWTCLDGIWDFAFDHETRWRRPEEVRWEAKIRVPFAPETPASGIGESGFFRSCWYRCTFEAPAMEADERLFLRFGAVDYSARVWINGVPAGRHDGGSTPFSFDITRLLSGKVQEIAVRAQDDPSDLAKPRGKQDWKLRPHGIWYPRTSGIWQTVWLERVPATWIRRIRWTPNLVQWEMGLEAELGGMRRDAYWLSVKLRAGTQLLSEDTYRVISGEVTRRIAFSDPGIDDFRNDLLWSPESPRLIDAQLELRGSDGKRLDLAHSYTALRSISTQGDRLLLNGRPYPLRFVLDQGYWPESGLTPPSDAALRTDVELVLRMGFNGVRKHQKIEDPRFFFWADRLGLLVWAEMPSAYRFTNRSINRLIREWTAVMARDYSHPCIIAWVPLNESWGVPNLPENPAERHYVRTLYHLTKTLDPTRPVVGNDGWESVVTDIIGIHDYDADPTRLARRYGAGATSPVLGKSERSGGRLLVLEKHEDLPVMLSEFGGIAIKDGKNETWGYSQAPNSTELLRRYEKLLSAVRSVGMFTGFCYTQFTDTYQEVTGLLNADRTPKAPLEQIARATLGITKAADREDGRQPSDLAEIESDAPHSQAAARHETES